MTKLILSVAKELVRSFTSFRMTLRARFFASLRMTGKKEFFSNFIEGYKGKAGFVNLENYLPR